jgi:formate dehydrogenase major subunit
LVVNTASQRATAAQVEAFDRILSNHLLYCTVCDNNNGNCAVHNTTKLLAIELQHIPFRSQPYEVDETNPFYRYDPDQCILCGRCVEACQNVEVNETLSINWEDPNPRVLWDGGSTIQESSCVWCGHSVTVCPGNALMEKSTLGHAGLFTSLKKKTLKGMIDVVKGVEPETGYGAILQVSEVEHATRLRVPCKDRQVGFWREWSDAASPARSAREAHQSPYKTNGRAVTHAKMRALALHAHPFHGDWNYELRPRPS